MAIDRNKLKEGNETEDELAGYGGEDAESEGSRKNPPKGHRVEHPYEQHSAVAGESDGKPNSDVDRAKRR